jgi:hypothetical protein
VSLKASLAAGDKLEPAAAEQLIRYLMEEAEGSAAKVRAVVLICAGVVCWDLHLRSQCLYGLALVMYGSAGWQL